MVHLQRIESQQQELKQYANISYLAERYQDENKKLNEEVRRLRNELEFSGVR
jgi:hypothetical protein